MPKPTHGLLLRADETPSDQEEAQSTERSGRGSVDRPGESYPPVPVSRPSRGLSLALRALEQASGGTLLES
jgi:hypothetical protein